MYIFHMNSFVIRNLPPETKVFNIKVKAVNQIELVGEAAEIKWGFPSCVTLQASYNKRIHKEIDRVKANKDGDFIDSDFLTVIDNKQ